MDLQELQGMLDRGELRGSDELSLANQYWFYVRESDELNHFLSLSKEVESSHSFELLTGGGEKSFLNTSPSTEAWSGGSGSDEEVTVVTSLQDLHEEEAKQEQPQPSPAEAELVSEPQKTISTDDQGLSSKPVSYPQEKGASLQSRAQAEASTGEGYKNQMTIFHWISLMMSFGAVLVLFYLVVSYFPMYSDQLKDLSLLISK